MRAIAFAGLAFALVAGAASAQTRLTDVQFIKAAECAGIEQGMKADTASVRAFLQSERAGRPVYVQTRAEQAMDEAKRKVKRAGKATLEELEAQRQGVCVGLLGASLTSAAR